MGILIQFVYHYRQLWHWGCSLFLSLLFFLIFCIISCLRVAFHKHFGDIKLLFFWSIYTPCVLRVYAQLCPTLCDPHGIQPSRLSPWNFPGKNTGVGFHFLLQVIFPIHGSNPHPCVSYIGRWSLPLVLPGNPVKAWGRANKTKKLEWYEETGTAERYECIKFLEFR